MQLTDQHEALRRTAERFIESEINPHVDAWEADEIFPAHEVFKKLGNLGLLGINKPIENGGLGLDYSYAAVFNEATGTINCGGIPMAIGVQTDMATPALARFGSAELRAEFLAPSIAGDMVACIGVSEPSAGSDVAAIKTRAVRQGGDYIINGSKMWITSGTQADWMCMLANTGDGPVHQNKSLIIVPLKENGKRAPGVSVGKKLRKMGMHSSDTALLYFEDVRVPARNLIGEAGRGFVYQLMQFQEERL
jgi:citronellyl-CoA dehydrogenase